jgi:transcriptional regulator with XRE-family HTH domain
MPTPVRLEIRNRQWLRDLRLEVGLTQEGLAEKAKISHSTLAKLEQGARTRVDPQTARAVCDVLKCAVTHLFRVSERVAS